MSELRIEQTQATVIAAGLSGGQTINGSTVGGENLDLSSTIDPVKGKINFGTNSTYDEVNGRLGIYNTTPSFLIEAGNSTYAAAAYITVDAATNQTKGFLLKSAGGTKWSIQQPASTTSLRIADDIGERIFIDRGGEVGIGQTPGSSKVHIFGASGTAVTLNVLNENLTTGIIARFITNSPHTGTRTLVSIVNDNTAAVNVTPFSIQQDALVSTNFRRIMAESNTGITTWISDGTSPNGNLSGTLGDICYNGSNGQLYRCTGTTNWVLIVEQSVSSLLSVVAATGISPIANNANLLMPVESSTAGDTTVTANPAIAAGTDGQTLIIIGTNDTKTVTLTDGNGITLDNGLSITLGLNDTIKFVSYGGTWAETSRTDNS